MSSLLQWLSPVAKDVLSTSVQLLQGKVPSPTKSLSSALQQAAKPEDSFGLLLDPTLRKEFASELERSGLKEITPQSSQQLVEIFGQVLSKQLEAVKTQAAQLAAKLPTKGPLSFEQVLKALNQEPSEALRTDWVLWHYMGCSHFPKELPSLPVKVVNERIALLACAASGLVDYAVKVHILEHLDAYQTWEASMAANQAQEAKPGLLAPFDAATCKEVALRRALGQALPAEIADQGAKAKAWKPALQSLADDAKSRAVLPSYSAPVAPKEEKAEGKEGKKRKADAPKGDAGAAGAAAVDAGAFAQVYGSTQTQEYRWHLLAYSMQPSTTLGAAAGTNKSSSSKAPASKSKTPGPQGFGGIWSPTGDVVPPGHTTYSWTRTESGNKGFSTIWAASASQCPPGHTTYSWEKGGGVTSQSSPSKAKAQKAAPDKTTPAAKAPAAAAGTDDKEAALAKIDLRCGRIVECSRVVDADSLYLLKINIGEEQPRQVVSSLVKHYKEEELKNRQVVVYCNIKPGKMRGLESQAMVLAAVKNKGAEDEVCELLDPPSGAAEGSRPMVGNLEVGSARDTVNVKNISKVWGQVQPSLLTNEKCEASFDGATMMMKEGPVRAKSLTNVAIS